MDPLRSQEGVQWARLNGTSQQVAKIENDEYECDFRSDFSINLFQQTQIFMRQLIDFAERSMKIQVYENFEHSIILEFLISRLS